MQCVDYEQSLLRSLSSETRETRKCLYPPCWPQSAFAARRSGASARSSLKLKKKRGCPQSMHSVFYDFPPKINSYVYISDEITLLIHLWKQTEKSRPGRRDPSWPLSSQSDQGRIRFIFAACGIIYLLGFRYSFWWQWSETILLSQLFACAVLLYFSFN